MAIIKESKRVKTGASLINFETQTISAINQLKGIKTNLLNLKTQMELDNDYCIDDINEVEAMIVELATRVQSLIS